MDRAAVEGIVRPVKTLNVLVVFSAVSALAAPPKAPAKAPAATPAPAAAPAAPKPDTSVAPKAAIAEMERLYKTLEYDAIIPLAEPFVKRADLSIDERVEGLRLLASAKVIAVDPTDGIPFFYQLLQIKPTYELPKDTPPKILAVFTQVKLQVDQEQAIVLKKRCDDARGAAQLIGEPPANAKGGKPLKFSFRLKDPKGFADQGVVLPYRRSGQAAYSTLALERSDEGDWRAVIPGEATADAANYTLEYYVLAKSSQPACEAFVSVGSEAQPKVIAMAAGTVQTPAFKPVPVWLFGVSLASTAIAGGFLAASGIMFNVEQSKYKQMGMVDGVLGSDLRAIELSGRGWASATNVMMIVTGVLAAITAGLTPFTKFSEEP